MPKNKRNKHKGGASGSRQPEDATDSEHETVPINYKYKASGAMGTFYVLTNHHIIPTLPGGSNVIWKYKITISIPKDSRLKTPDDDKATTQQKARVFLKKELTDELGEHFVFDGTSLGWSTKCIVEEKKNITFTINMEKRKDNAPNKIDVNVYNMGKLDLKKFKEYIEKGVYEKNPTGNADWEDIIKWVQAAFRKDPEQRLVAKPKSNAFYVKNESFEEKLGSLLDSRKGVFQTMQLRFGRMTLNVDTATTAFWRSNLNLLDVVLQQCRTQNPAALTNYWQNKRADFLNDIRRIPGVYFYTPHVNEYHKKINKDNKDWEERPHQRMKMTGFCSGTALTHKFPKDKTKPNDLTTVFAYFKEKYGITVKYPNLPLIEFGKGNVPMELCWSCADEQFKGEMDSYEKAKFVKDSAVYPNGRFSKINEKLSLLNHAEAATLAAHGLGITKEQMKVEATKLVAPMLRYGTGGKFSAGNGRWNLHNRTFVTPMTIKSWALIYLPGREDIPAQFSATAYADNIRVQWGKCGLKVPMGNLPVLNWPKDGYKPASAVSVVESAIALARTTFKLDPNLLLFILPEDSFNAVNYREIKRELNITRGIASQVLLNTKIHRNSEDSAKMQYLANIAMKVNVKLGGLNCISDENFFFGRPGSKRTMVLGADITHADSEDLKDKTKEPPPSYAALVGTWDRDCHCYTAVTAAQKTGEAMVKDFKRMVQVMLDRYSAKNKILAKTALPQHGWNNPTKEGDFWPARILYYRDGTSESEFDRIIDEEIKYIREVLTERNIVCDITCIVAIKRHHTRFQNLGVSRDGNVDNGTVVVNADEGRDAYIVAQPELQGTKRPTRYVTIVNECNLSAADIQRVTFAMCSSYARATTSVAVCPPVYYADQAADLVSQYHRRSKAEGPLPHRDIHENLEYTMWWQ